MMVEQKQQGVGAPTLAAPPRATPRTIPKPIPNARREDVPATEAEASTSRDPSPSTTGLLCSCPEAGKRWLPEEQEEDCCCVCLETFTEDNPAKATKCGHQYHLQCIMQWYQRSPMCPMCFREVELVCQSSQQLMMEATRPFVSTARARDAASAASAASTTATTAARRLEAVSRAAHRNHRAYGASTRSLSQIETGSSGRSSGSGFSAFRKTAGGFFNKLRLRSRSNSTQL